MCLILHAVPFLVLVTKGFTSRVSRQSRDWDQCYYAKGAVAPPELLPCLNETSSEASEASWCCFAGDECLDQACWDPDTTNTYQYGCNDPNYEHKNCPPKGGLNMTKSPWVGVVLCDPDAADDTFWACHHPDTCGESCPLDPTNVKATLSFWPWKMIELPQLPNRCEDMATLVLATFGPNPMSTRGGVPANANGIEGKPTPTRLPVKATVPRPVSDSVWASNTSLPSNPPVEIDGTGDAGWNAGAVAGTVVGAILSAVAIVGGTLLMRRRQQQQHGLQSDTSQTSRLMEESGAIELMPSDDKRRPPNSITPMGLSDRVDM